jgi:hypothetical protein
VPLPLSLMQPAQPVAVAPASPHFHYWHGANVELGSATGPNGELPSASNPGPFTPDLRYTDDRVLLNVTLRL